MVSFIGATVFCFCYFSLGVISSIVISLERTGKNEVSSGLALKCNSTGWYPEPEVFWLDGEGNLLSAGPTETVRGPDDLYTVSSRVTVEKRHSNSFTCRVQQNHTNQIREAQIHVPGGELFCKFFTSQFLSIEKLSSFVSNFRGCIHGAIFVFCCRTSYCIVCFLCPSSSFCTCLHCLETETKQNS